MPNFKHGHSKGGKRSPEHSAWDAMRQRCHNPNHPDFPRYGGRSIVVCDRWRESFEAFLEDMGPRPGAGFSIERKNNDIGYQPSNCIWADQKTQNRNRSNCRIVEYLGKKVTLSEAIEMGGLQLHRTTVAARLNSGWPVARAIETPADQRFRP